MSGELQIKTATLSAVGPGETHRSGLGPGPGQCGEGFLLGDLFLMFLRGQEGCPANHRSPWAQGDVLRPSPGAGELWPRRRTIKDLLPGKAERVARNVEIANLQPLLLGLTKTVTGQLEQGRNYGN